mmetsp:Transcript_21439/g.25537  ORF Transcript_21439/g.25537 Transcript_21439/m.25537 type:complete len:83 (-) Transcript_21439:162-410(-)
MMEELNQRKKGIIHQLCHLSSCRRIIKRMHIYSSRIGSWLDNTKTTMAIARTPLSVFMDSLNICYITKKCDRYQRCARVARE